MAYFAVKELGLGMEEALYWTPASQLMLMLNQHVVVNAGEESSMTLSDIELADRMAAFRKGASNG